MIRSSHSFRRTAALFAAALVCLTVLPVAAFAQNLDPTDVEYGPREIIVAGDDPGTGQGGDPGSDPGISELPFTGLDVAAIAAIGAGLLGAGLVVRKASRAGETA